LTQEDLLNLAELQQANDNVKAFGVVLWLEASFANHIQAMPSFLRRLSRKKTRIQSASLLPLSADSLENETRTLANAAKLDMFVVGLCRAPFPGKALLKTFCDGLREQRLEREVLQVHLSTAEPSGPEANCCFYIKKMTFQYNKGEFNVVQPFHVLVPFLWRSCLVGIAIIFLLSFDRNSMGI
jgi:hypothetical protein